MRIPGGAGYEIAFTALDADVVILEADGSRRVVVKNAAHPSWSPDGRWIAFERAARDVAFSEGVPDDVWTVRADGTRQRRLTASPHQDHEPAWSPDGKRILYVSRRDSGNPEVYVMNADGTGQRRLTSSPGAERDPSWSPDGRRIAYSEAPDPEYEYESDIGVMAPDGGSRGWLTGPADEDNEPESSPDGKRIAFASEGRILVVNADGTRHRVLTHGGRGGPDFFDGEPSWSPDGRWLVFERLFWAPFEYECWAVRQDGSGLRRLTGPGCTDPKWRPVASSKR